MEVLSNAGTSASLQYRGACDKEHTARFDLPQLRVPGPTGGDPLTALTEIFKDDTEMQVTRGANGIIRLRETQVSDDLLAIRIQRVAFKDDEIFPPTDDRFDQRDAMHAVLLRTPEVTAFMNEHGIARRFAFEQAGGSRQIPSPKSPRLADTLTNVTLSQALDNVLQTFPGLWIYEECPSRDGNRIVDFGIYRDNPMWSRHRR
jgi:hypothetical protein